MQINAQELATLRAALRYWQEEMCPQKRAVQQLYFDEPLDDSLTAQAIERLREGLHPPCVRYAIWIPRRGSLAGLELWDAPPEVSAGREERVVTVLFGAD